MDLGLRRIAIVNRGEAAMRSSTPCVSSAHEHEADIRTIALHTRAERGAMFVREADEAVCIDEGRAAAAGNPYLHLDALRRALVAGAGRFGVGRVGVRRGTARVRRALRRPRHRLHRSECRRDAPPRRQDRAKLLAEQAGVPVAPWSGGPVHTIEEAHAHAEAIGFPLMIKATAGGGGRGIRKVDDAAGLAEAFTAPGPKG